jgi:hypothetical protein
MKQLNELFRWIETREAVLTFLSLALVAQIPHVAELVLHIVGRYDWLAYIHAYIVATAFDGAILVFVTRQRTGLAWVFAIGSMLMNMGHYVPPVLARHATLASPQAIVDIGAAMLLSIALPFALAQYSHVASDDTHIIETKAATPHPAAPSGVTDVPVLPTPAPVLPQPMPADAPLRPACAYEGCINEAFPCEHGCHEWVCSTHKGNHNQWRCTHNSKSRAYASALLEAANGHQGV